MASEMIANRYVLVQLIGEGGMASVYLAVDTILKREVAVKILRGELSKDPVALLRFQREANATTKLSHPNVVEVYDVGEDNGKNYIVMEYVKGRSLKELVQRRGALPKEEAVNIMKQLVSAVAVAHKNGIIHRDIKSQNVLIKDDGTVKLSDFGIALATDTTQLTQTDVVVGSVHYLAPELAKGESATQQSDIYSLGIVFFEMITGDVPHHGEAPVQVALKHMRENIPSVREYNPNIPQSIDNIIVLATVKNKTFRYVSAGQMYEDLVTCLDISRAKEPRVSFDEEDDSTLEMDSPARDPKKMKNIAIIGGISVVAIGLVVLVLFLTGILSTGPKKVLVPEISGLSIEAATEKLKEYGLNVSATYKYELTQDIDKGFVSQTEPQTGVEVNKGTTIVLIISEGTYYVMPDFTDWSIEDVELELQNCCNIKIYKEYEDSVEKEVGMIVSQSLPEGTLVNPGRIIDITFLITRNPEFMIPVNIVGMKVADAQKALEKLGGIVKKTKLDIPKVKQDPSCVDTPAQDDGMGGTIPAVVCTLIPDPSITTGVVSRVDPDEGIYYTQTKKSTIILYYY